MALPMQKTPWYTLTIPSTEKEVKFRPFLVKEQKALLLAQQSEEQKVMLDTLKSTLSECVQGDVKVDDLAVFDLEYMFSQIRAKSVGEIVELILRCDTCSDEKAKVKVSVDLTQVKVEKPAGHTKKIELFDDVGIIMKYPKMDLLRNIETIAEDDDIDAVFDLMTQCIDIIYAGDELHHAHEYTKKELVEFLENLTEDQFKKIQQFFETMPKLEKRLDYKCPICAKDQSVMVSGLDSFF
jgi:hypothetical protein